MLLYQKLRVTYDKDDQHKEKDPGRKMTKKEVKYVSIRPDILTSSMSDVVMALLSSVAVAACCTTLKY